VRQTTRNGFLTGELIFLIFRVGVCLGAILAVAAALVGIILVVIAAVV
jgi:hypothetical protein